MFKQFFLDINHTILPTYIGHNWPLLAIVQMKEGTDYYHGSLQWTLNLFYSRPFLFYTVYYTFY